MVLAEKALPVGVRALTLDFERVKGGVGLPIELLDSFRLTNQARFDYLDAIVGYNRAQLDLYVALGQPPADALARPVPTTDIQPSTIDKK
jgi:outer membrane protein TolC